MTDRSGFDEFVHARGPALARTAYLLTGDHHLAEDLTAAHAVMALAHAAAAAVVGLWLARGEHALWLLVALAGHALVPMPRLSAAVVTAWPRVAPVDHAQLPPDARAFTTCVRRRGPPVRCAP